MKTPCELVVGKFLPSLRASVVKELSNGHGMKQSEIARKLGITQASVSQYLSATRAGDDKLTERFPKILIYAKEISGRIMAGESRNQWHSILCDACRDIREDDEFCKMHNVVANLKGCNICRQH
ncbi:MAG: helix-turn-helix domain-containing protein [Methanobacteriota archaeon]|nr:MAG: helix-turn-helix domain-containing protein [Euryarchaeota archaeon]